MSFNYPQDVALEVTRLCVVEDTLVIDHDVGFLTTMPLPWTSASSLLRVVIIWKPL